MELDFGLLLIRIAVGVVIAAHGAQKLFGWFGGSGIGGTEKMMNRLHLQPTRFWAYASALNEFLGGVLTALGLLMPVGPLMILANMLVAVVFVHWQNGFWNLNKGYEYPLVIGANALGLSIAGGGVYALDAFLPFGLPEPFTLYAGLIVVIAGLLVTLALAGRLNPSAHEPVPRPR
jgi:putative oxidoreductase